MPSTTTAGLVHRIFTAWDAAGVAWVLLRGRAGVGATGRDVDLLVCENDLGEAENVIFAMGGVALPRALHPWHRFYSVEDRETGERVQLDVVTELSYGRQRQLRSELQGSCLAGRRRDGGLYVLDPTDMFWTVLLHCLLDKGSVGSRRRTELETAVPEVRRPSHGEEVFARVCPPDWSADRAVDAVTARDWDAVSSLAQRMVGPAPAAARSTPSSVTWVPRRVVRRAARAVYPTLWRRAGMGATPAVLDILKATGMAGIDATVHRRPGLCQVDLVVADHQQHRLATVMRSHGYRRIAGAWHRATPVGLERVRMLMPIGLLPSPEDGAEPQPASRPAPEHTHGRGGRARRGVQSPNRPLRVSLSGLDGAGKSQQIATLVASLGREHSVDVVWLPTKVWPESLLNRLPAGLRSRLGPKRTAVLRDLADSPPPRRRAADRLRSVAWTTIGTVAALSVGCSLRYRASRSSADVLVLDRYRLDSLVKVCNWYSEAPVGWLAGIVRILAPPADVEILLRVDPAVAHARKAEQWSVAQLTCQARLYDRLAVSLGVTMLDGQQPAEDVARAVGSHVQAVLKSRPDGRPHGH